MKYILYGNGSSGNHGCEAIVRGTKALLEGEMRLHSAEILDDEKYGLMNLCDIVPARTVVKKDFKFLFAYLKMKILKKYIDLDGLEYLDTINYAKAYTTIALSVGGDNYCYAGTEIYEYLNRQYHKKGFKTVLWGCSVEPIIVEKNKKDFCRYDLVVARESITYEAMKKNGANVILAPDPAFFMKEEECVIDPRLLNSEIIGINISPHILKCESNINITYKNYLELIRYILKETDANIALIPHVVWESNDDRKVLRKLYEDAGCSERMILIEDHTAPELKYIISCCKIFVGARTHATIAAYSSYVPTLVVGYSVKARGIARDLFGTKERYVIPVQELENPMTLVETFQWFEKNHEKIQKHLKEVMPEYISRGYKAKEEVLSLF